MQKQNIKQKSKHSYYYLQFSFFIFGTELKIDFLWLIYEERYDVFVIIQNVLRHKRLTSNQMTASGLPNNSLSLCFDEIFPSPPFSYVGMIKVG